jgi:hypothetical protein
MSDRLGELIAENAVLVDDVRRLRQQLADARAENERLRGAMKIALSDLRARHPTWYVAEKVLAPVLEDSEWTTEALEGGNGE